jgi:hypothetical protein
METITKVSENFWRLDTTFDERRLVFFGGSAIEVLGKYRAWVRAWEQEKGV